MKINILLTGVGGATPRSIARSLHHYSSLEVCIIGTDVNPMVYGLYEDDLYHKTYVIPAAGDPDYWPIIGRLIEKHDIDIAIVQPEKEVLEWTRYKSTGKEWPCPVLLPDYAIVQKLLDKSLMTDLLMKSDLVPNSLHIDPANLDLAKVEKNSAIHFGSDLPRALADWAH